jgi:predicted nuclease of predicted toxin-antitoxin system
VYFLADENYPFDAVRRLRKAGHDVAAIVRDSSGASDEEILERAVREARVVLTFDRDYGRLLYEESLVPVGIVYFRFDPSPPEEPADYLLALLAQPGFSVAGKLTVLERDRVRQRPLPEAG